MINLTKIALLAFASVLIGVPALRAQTLVFTVDINTTGLSSASADAPFYLDFAMTYGNSSLASSSATISSFSFTGGSALGSAVASGGASGDFSSSVSVLASSTHPITELYQQFSSTVTDIKFQVSVTEPGPNPQGTPSTFTASILDNSLGSPAQIFTTAPDTTSLVTLSLDASNTIENVGFFTGNTSADGNTALSPGVTAVPEPSTTAAILGSIGVIVAACVRHFRRKQMA